MSASSLRLSGSVRGLNRAAVLRMLFERGPLPRYQIAEQLGLTGASISRIVAECLEAGLIQELPPANEPSDGSVSAGRRPIPIILNPDYYAVAAVHVGLLWLDVGLLNLQGQLIAHYRHRRPEHPAADILSSINQDIRALISEHHRQLLATGLTLNGQVSPESGSILPYNVLAWPRISVTESLALAPVRVETNVYAMALAEYLHRPTDRGHSLLLVNIGTTIGMGLIVNHAILRGQHGRLGFLEHLPGTWSDVVCEECGVKGCMSSAISDRAIFRQLRSLYPQKTFTNIQDVLEVGKTPGPAYEILRERAFDVGRFLAILAIQHDPTHLILAGSCLLDNGQQLAWVRSAYRHTLDSCAAEYSPVESPTVYAGELFPLVGAGTVALHTVFSADLEITPGPPQSPFSHKAQLSLVRAEQLTDPQS